MPGESQSLVGRNALDSQGNRSINKNNGSNGTQVSKKSVKRLNQKVTHSALSFFPHMQERYKILKDIFTYFNSGDLVTASFVCKFWKDVAFQDEMWKIINLNGVKVCNWQKLVEIIKKKKATQLDMRGMKTFEDCNRTWHEFVAILQQMKTTKIEEINFGFVTVSVLHAVLDILTDLKALTAESIVDVMYANCCSYGCARIRIGGFARLKNLKKLHLRGVRGIQLPLTQQCSSLSDLGSIQTLQYLSLTSLKNIPASEFMFIQKLVHITTLEIGCCTTWNAEVYKQLLHLKHLTRLRLECGFDIEHSLSQVFETLTELKVIELETFKIDEYLMKRISLMPYLEGLSLWPDESQEPRIVNSVVMQCMKYLNRLKIFKWQVKAIKVEETSQKTGADDYDDDVVIIEDANSEYLLNSSKTNNDFVKKGNLPFAKGVLSTGEMTNIENLNSYILKIMNRKYKNGKILLFHSGISININVESRILDEDLFKIR